MNLAKQFQVGVARREDDFELLAQAALASSSFRAIRMLRAARSGEAIVLSGTVSTYYCKQVAQELVRTACGPLQVVNAVEVV